jgi:hypothetical protein
MRKGFLICGIGLQWRQEYIYFLFSLRSLFITFGIVMFTDQKREKQDVGVESYWEWPLLFNYTC